MESPYLSAHLLSPLKRECRESWLNAVGSNAQIYMAYRASLRYTSDMPIQFPTDIFTVDPLTFIFLLNLALAIILGAVIGAEREYRGKDAGISTNTFVLCGAMLFTFLSMVVDPASKSRIAAQIVSGIGFLGAGLILKDGAGIRNLTTAASIWFSGAIGMAIGFGYYAIAITATLASVFIPRIPHVKKYSESKQTQNDEVSASKDDQTGAPTSDD